MIKVIVLRFIAIISICIGEGCLIFGTFAPNTFLGFLELLGAVALLFICFFFAIFCLVKADDIDDKINGFDDDGYL